MDWAKQRWTEERGELLWPIEEGTKNKPVAKSISRLQTSEPRLAGCSASDASRVGGAYVQRAPMESA